MAGTTVTISKDAEKIAKKYGSNVSHGIIEMERLLAFMRAEDARKVTRALGNSHLESIGNLES